MAGSLRRVRRLSGGVWLNLAVRNVVRILSIDVGGIRGIVPATLLSRN